MFLRIARVNNEVHSRRFRKDGPHETKKDVAQATHSAEAWARQETETARFRPTPTGSLQKVFFEGVTATTFALPLMKIRLRVKKAYKDVAQSQVV